MVQTDKVLWTPDRGLAILFGCVLQYDYFLHRQHELFLLVTKILEVVGPGWIVRVPIVVVSVTDCLDAKHRGTGGGETLVLDGGPVVSLVTNQSGTFEPAKRRVDAPGWYVGLVGDLTRCESDAGMLEEHRQDFVGVRPRREIDPTILR